MPAKAMKITFPYRNHYEESQCFPLVKLLLNDSIYNNIVRFRPT